MTDDHGTDGPDRGHGLAAAAAVGALGLLAGCSAGPQDAPPTVETATGTPWTETGTAWTQDEPPGTATAAVTLSTAECRTELEALEAELEDVRARADRLESELPALRRQRDAIEQTAELFETPPAEVIEQARAVGTAARDAVVFLDLGGGLATGWYVDDHHIVTNAHNVFDHHTGEHRSPTVWTFGGEQTGTTTVDFVESLLPDVALLRSDAPGPATLPPGANPAEDSEEPLVQVGHPGGLGNWRFTLGRFRRYQTFQDRDGNTVEELQTTVPGRPGVSGSPVLNLDGEVVGLTYAGSPVQSKEPEEPPIVAEPVVYDRPVASLSWGSHVTIETVMTHYEEWT